MFQTHKGLRRYRTLNVATSSASEIIQSVIAEELRDILHTLSISDNVIVFGANQKEHAAALRQVFQRFSSCGLTLNKENANLIKTSSHFSDSYSQQKECQLTLLKLKLSKVPLLLQRSLDFEVSLAWPHIAQSLSKTSATLHTHSEI